MRDTIYFSVVVSTWDFRGRAAIIQLKPLSPNTNFQAWIKHSATFIAAFSSASREEFQKAYTGFAFLIVFLVFRRR